MAQDASDNSRLFVSFWRVGLENLPEGKFVHRRVAPDDAKTLVDAARATQTLACVSHHDLLAPYHEDERRTHEALCKVLCDRYDVVLAFEDFLLEDEVEGDDGYMVRPLVFAEVEGGCRLLVVNCHYELATERKLCALEFKLAADSVTFHLFEAIDYDA